LFVVEFGERRSFVKIEAAVIGVSGNAGNENVLINRVFERFRPRLDALRQLTAGVNHGVPISPAQFVQIAVAVALNLLDIREIFRRMPAAIKKRDLVTAALRRRD